MDRARPIPVQTPAARPVGEAHTQVLPRPRRIGPYRVLGELGHGGMADVYLAENTELPNGSERPCVLKVLRPELAASAEYVQMFEEEVRITSLLSHPSIVRCGGGGVIGGAHFMVLELCAGRTLLQVMKDLGQLQHPFPIDVAVFIGHELALALAYVHGVRDAADRKLGLVHRDVSPSNVMLTHRGEVKLLDFGVAKATRETGRPRVELTRADTVKGKVRYMAPEQVQGRALDGRADLFSLGVLLWELLAGRSLFSRGTTQETAALIVNGPIVPLLCTIRDDVPLPLEAIVARLLERDPGRRFQSGRALAAELAPLLAPRPHGERALAGLMHGLEAQLSARTPTPPSPRTPMPPSPRTPMPPPRTPLPPPRRPSPRPQPAVSRTPRVAPPPVPTPRRAIPRVPTPPRSPLGLPPARAMVFPPPLPERNERTQLLYRRRPLATRLFFILAAASAGFASGVLWQRGFIGGGGTDLLGGEVDARSPGVAIDRIFEPPPESRAQPDVDEEQTPAAEGRSSARPVKRKLAPAPQKRVQDKRPPSKRRRPGPARR